MCIFAGRLHLCSCSFAGDGGEAAEWRVDGIVVAGEGDSASSHGWDGPRRRLYEGGSHVYEYWGLSAARGQSWHATPWRLETQRDAAMGGWGGRMRGRKRDAEESNTAKWCSIEGTVNSELEAVDVELDVCWSE